MRTIRQQLTLKLILSVALLLAAGGTVFFLAMRNEFTEEFDATLKTKAAAIAAVTRQRGDHVDVEPSGRLTTTTYEMWRRDGTRLERSESLGGADLPFDFGSFDRPKVWNVALPNGSAARAAGLVFSPRVSDSEPPVQGAPEIVLVVASSRGELDRTLGRLGGLLGICGVLLLAATWIVIPRVLRRELAPLNDLAECAARIDADSLATRFPAADVPGELAPISHRLNDLLARLERSFERERQFSADLAHELRTPIAELRSLAEIALKWPEARLAEADQDALVIALQMEGIVTRLLALLRSERGQLPVARERITLAPLVASVWQPLAARATAKRLQVTMAVPEGIAVDSDPVLLRSILANLMENAVEYTPHDGVVRIDGDNGGERCALRVTNTTDELTQADVPKLFDRFWRRDRARSDAGHSGLGLSLARAFAVALGCDLSATLDRGSHLTLTLLVGGGEQQKA